MSQRARRDPYGPALLLLGVLALGRAWVLSAPPLTVGEVGEPVPLDPYALSGDEFRLLPGVGPVLAGRLEAARVAAGGRLTPAALRAVSGVGPALLRRWDPQPPD
jgi:predicted flap endonuclease-1-like 5' DNA nuclease